MGAIFESSLSRRECEHVYDRFERIYVFLTSQKGILYMITCSCDVKIVLTAEFYMQNACLEVEIEEWKSRVIETVKERELMKEYEKQLPICKCTLQTDSLVV